ncbi:hypothetical protein [Sphingopyxis sp.]|uniref:hypothetical protein n=1 Tax=Sphingopyxis sp. TaxID=1908224 RepID=UPI00262E4816|nr:hypothetical protein [Sphingopyxis sp.]MCW0196630.1 hypothetical protein [Sphingopyxis sp.]
MPQNLRRSLSIALGALATTTLGGCYYGDVYGSSYASGGDCASRYGSDYYDSDGYAYDDGYGYDCYDAADYSGGFAQIGFGGGWYDDYYYPGYGMWLFDSYRNRYPLRGQYLNYWGGRRAWWKHHKDRPNGGNWTPRPGQGSHDGKPGRPSGWNHGDRDGSHGRPPAGTKPGTPPPTAVNPNRPDRGPGAARPYQPRPGGPGDARPPRNWSPGANGPRRPQATAPAPATPPAARPSAARPAAPVARPAPPPAAPRRATPPRRPDSRHERPQ